MFREESIIDLISITEQNNLEIRRADKVFKNDELISKTYHRHVLQPGDSLEGQDPKVVKVAQVLWSV